jgi:hypothetical protein
MAISEIHEVSVNVYFIYEGLVSQPSSYDWKNYIRFP